MATTCLNQGGRSRRKVYITYLTTAVLQILTSLLRQLSDFLGPLWTLILVNFLTIVFAIFGFYGAYVRTAGRCCVVAHTLFSTASSIFNIVVILLYTYPPLQVYRSSVLSLRTGALSYFETRGPGCVPDWAQNTIYNCYLDPILVECSQALLQVILGLSSLITGLLLLCTQEEKPPIPSSNKNGTPALASPDLRPMTPRRVKRRSARSIQSNNYGRNSRSNSLQQRSYRSPLNRLIDSETSYDERPPVQTSTRGFSNRGYQNSIVNNNPSASSSVHGSHRRRRHHHQQHQPPPHWRNQPTISASSIPPPPGPPPRPPSARSSYSNYHAARQMAAGGLTNPSFDGTEFFYESRPVYPLAHSPVSQSEYPLQHGPSFGNQTLPWQQQQNYSSQQQMMVAMGQVPVSPGERQHNSETVI